MAKSNNISQHLFVSFSPNSSSYTTMLEYSAMQDVSHEVPAEDFRHSDDGMEASEP